MQIKNIIILFIAVFLGTVALPCSLPKNGAGMEMDELIEKSDVIVLAEVVEIVPEVANATHFYLKPTRVLKGEPSKRIEFMNFSPKQSSSNDFDGHKKEEFWIQDIGRSKWPCCICGPDHFFEPGETYLLFPDSFGAMKSAELIKSDDDKWLIYVESKIKEEHIKSVLTTTGAAAPSA